MFRKLTAFFQTDRGASDSAFAVDKLPSDPQLQVAMANAVLGDLLKERAHNRRWTLIKRAGLAAMFAMGLGYSLFFQAKFMGWSLMPSDPLVGVVRIEGSIANTTLASAEKVVAALKKAFETPNVKAVILAIDSPGGAPVEAERINYVLDELKAKHKKPVYAVIQNVGASAGYMIAMHADQIYAGKYSMVGSIGAVMSSWDVHKALERFEIYQKVYASGELKAMLNPFVASTPAAEEKAHSIVNVMGGRFAEELRERRGKLLQDGFRYDTGEIWDGEGAKKIGLIDGLATIESVAARIEGAKIHEFGPTNIRGGLFSTAVGDWVQSVLSGALSGAMRSAFATQPEIR
jgi:protease IV